MRRGKAKRKRKGCAEGGFEKPHTGRVTANKILGLSRIGKFRHFRATASGPMFIVPQAGKIALWAPSHVHVSVTRAGTGCFDRATMDSRATVDAGSSVISFPSRSSTGDANGRSRGRVVDAAVGRDV